jgi:O-antigen/teichoic acid export membrane protein
MISLFPRMLGRARQSRFLRRLGLLSGGTMFGQGLIVLTSPLLTRLYTPEQFGLFAVFSALSAIMGVAIGLRYEFAVPVVKQEEDAAALVAAATLVTCLLSGALAVLLLFWSPELAAMVGLGDQATLLWLLPPAMLLWGVGSGLSFWAIRQGLFRLNGVNRVVQFGTQAAGQLGLGLIGLGSIGLVLGYVLGYLTRFVHLALALPKLDLAQLCRPSLGRLRQVLHRHWYYPVFSASSSLLQSACHMLPAVLVALLYGPALAGLFALSQRVVGLPVRLFSDSASQVFLGEIATADRDRLVQLFKKITLLFLGIGLLGMLPLLLAGPWLFALVFGEEWRQAGTIVQILVPLHLARFVVRPVSQTLNVLQRQDLHLTSSIINALTLATSFSAGWWWTLDALWTLFIFSISSSIAWTFYLFIAWRQLKRAAVIIFD